MVTERTYFISHPEVVIDKTVPVSQWDLSDKGRVRLGQLLEKPWISDIEAIYSSMEKKAVTTAKVISDRLNIPVNYVEELGEMDRSSTGVLELLDFEQTVDQFFSNPEISIRGWERAVDAQERIINAVKKILEKTQNKNVAIVSHGGVGSLLICHLKGVPINRAEDQPGQGHFFVFETDSNKLIHSWESIS